MKKIFLCFILLPLIFSCGLNKWDDTVITNNSDETVTFKFSNSDKIELLPGKNHSFPTKAHQYLESYSPEKMVYFDYTSTNDGYTGEFKQRKSWTVKISNTFEHQATLTADGWMKKTTIPGNESKEEQIYTDTPDFKVTLSSDSSPVVAVYKKDGDDFLVTIKWMY